MRIDFDQDVDQTGYVMAIHFIDTSDPAVIATMKAINGNPAAQAQAGYAEVHKVAGRPAGETRYQHIVALLATAPANDPVKQLNLK